VSLTEEEIRRIVRDEMQKVMASTAQLLVENTLTKVKYSMKGLEVDLVRVISEVATTEISELT